MKAAALGQHKTPPPLARELCSGLHRADPAGGVLDPCCGDGELLIAAWESGVAPEALHGIELDAELAEVARQRLRLAVGGRCGERAAANVRCADALDPAREWPARTSIVANPPWVSFSGRASARRGEKHVSETGGWPSLHGAFLERIAEHLRAERTAARVLLPASVAELGGYAPLRERVTALASLSAPPLPLGERAFPGVTEPAILLTLAGRARKAAGSPAPWTPPSPLAAELMQHLADFPRLDGAFSDPGVHTGNAAPELVLDASEERYPGLRAGRDLQPYRLRPPRLRLRTDLARTSERRFRIAPLERYRSVPVLLRQTADRPRAALHVEPTYFRNSLLACTPPPGLAPAFVVGVLNSAVAAAWHRLTFADARQRAFPQVKVGHLRTQPFPIADRCEAPRLHDRIASLVREGAASASVARRIEERLEEAFDLTRELARRVRAAVSGRPDPPGG